MVCGSRQGPRHDRPEQPGQPDSDTFYIDYVAHEMGHQFGGNHTFNNSCGGNRAASAAYEPGSGSTIMAYAGVCSPNLQPHSDPYFHAKSLQEIGNFTNGSGGCLLGDHAEQPVARAWRALSGHTIPANTPFALTGAATSVAPGAALTFGWEQYDLGAATVDINVDPGNGPIIRSFNPTPTPTRTVPNFAKLLTGTSTIGEILPTTTRALNFRLTVFDNVAGGGTTESQNLGLQVVNTAGPFAVTSPARRRHLERRGQRQRDGDLECCRTPMLRRFPAPMSISTSIPEPISMSRVAIAGRRRSEHRQRPGCGAQPAIRHGPGPGPLRGQYLFRRQSWQLHDRRFRPDLRRWLRLRADEAVAHAASASTLLATGDSIHFV